VGRDTIDLHATLARLRGILIGVGLLAVVVSAGVLTWVVRRSLKPVDRLGGRIAALGADDWSARIDSADVPLELAPIVDRLNELLSRLGAAFQRERRFTGDVAHELRTPLAGLRTKLELALSRDRDPEAYRKTLDDCLQIDLHLQSMVETLLHLARADAGQLDVRTERVVLSKIIRETWEPLQERAAARELNVEWRLDDTGPIDTDPDKLQLVVRNVLENAVGHADDRGTVCIATQPANGALTLTVSNTGSRLSADQVRHVFDRFWRGDASSPEADDHHCGLGLPLCKTIVERLGGAIEASMDADGSFTVTIRLPGDGQ
ncbi:MAG: hypothetical protein GY778_31360, partial [bacterium]|nr:hypothetical protein [bacterium]